MKTATLTDHARRIARAMALLAERVDAPPSLEEMAGVAAFSPCHFHRAYRSLTGETPAETLARLRLSRAAVVLIKSDAPMAKVAKGAGYGSVAAFNRAFREAHGLPPGAYRAAGGIGSPKQEEEAMHHVRMIDWPAMTLAVLDHRGPYDDIGAVFDRLIAWGTARGLIEEATRFVALYWDDPKSVPDADLRAVAGFAVPADTAVSDGVRLVGVPAMHCAALRFKGPYAELEGAYDWFYGTWLPGSGEAPADQPMMEEYLNDCRSLPPQEWLTDILMPLKARVPAIPQQAELLP